MSGDEPRLDDELDTLIAIEHLIIAGELYRHEDNLNWQKLTNFLYVTVGLVAIGSLVLAGGITNHVLYWSLLVSGVLGAIVSILFYITLRAGVAYMNHRKDTFSRLEARLIHQPELRIHPDPETGAEHTLLRSPTGRVLRILPLGTFIMWIFVCVFSIQKLVTYWT